MTISKARRWRSWGHWFSPDSHRNTVRSDIAPRRPVNSRMASLTAAASSPADIWCFVIQAAKSAFLVSATTAP